MTQAIPVRLQPTDTQKRSTYHQSLQPPGRLLAFEGGVDGCGRVHATGWSDYHHVLSEPPRFCPPLRQPAGIDPLSEPEFESLSREEKIEQLMPLYQNSRSRAEEELMMWEHRQR